MGGIRISQQLLVSRVLFNLRSQTERLQDLQDQLSTQLRVNRPSDDPLAARRAINARADTANNEQYLTNIANLKVGSQETESAITTVNQLVIRAKELALQSSNGINGPAQMNAFAVEINQIIENVFQQSNHVTNGRYIFAGTHTDNPAFSATRDANGDITAVTFDGNDTKINSEVSDGVYISTNETGQDVFLSSVSIFQTLIDLRDNLRANNSGAIQTQLTELDQSRDQLLGAVSRVGATQNRLENIDSGLRDLQTQLQDVLSQAIDADYADVLVHLNAESNAYQAALNAGARVIQPSLLDYVR